MIDYHNHLIFQENNVLTALGKLDSLAPDAILFVVDSENRLLGSLTDGDIRRGLLKGLSLDESIKKFIEPNPRFIRQEEVIVEELIRLRDRHFKLVPVLDKNGVILKIINLRLLKSYLPVDVVIMAGGRGERLRPLTDNTPKPMLHVGNKPIIEHNIDRLVNFGIENIWISVKYLGEQIVDHFKDGESKQVNIKYIQEEVALGTLGAVSLIDTFVNDTILVMNSDLLNNIDFEAMYVQFKECQADLMISTISYEVNIPYAILDIDNSVITALNEKPVKTYLANAGVYLLKRSVLNLLPYNKFYDATDLIDQALKLGYKVVPFNHLGYWLDIGKHSDFEKAQKDIHNLRF